jgi:hypothetical protein
VAGGADGWDGLPADPTPSCAALAGAGSAGVTAVGTLELGLAATVDRADFAPSDLPGRMAETSAANPAVRAAAATIIQRRVRLIRCSAASRSRTGSSDAATEGGDMVTILPGFTKEKVRIRPARR